MGIVYELASGGEHYIRDGQGPDPAVQRHTRIADYEPETVLVP